MACTSAVISGKSLVLRASDTRTHGERAVASRRPMIFATTASVSAMLRTGSRPTDTAPASGAPTNQLSDTASSIEVWTTALGTRSPGTPR